MEHATALAQAMTYPPVGTRGFGAAAHRVARYALDTRTHLHAPRNDVALIVMNESSLGVANLDRILSVEGMDGVFIFPCDPSVELGSAGDFSQRKYVEALAPVEQAVRDRGKILGIGPHSGNSLEALTSRVRRLILLDTDMPLIQTAMSAGITKPRLSL